MYYSFIFSVFRMRNYKKKTDRGTKSLEVYELAAKEVIEKKTSLRKTAKDFNLCHVTLYKFIKAKKENAVVRVGYTKPRLIFSSEQEAKLTYYLLKCSNTYYGLLPAEVRKLAYQCASVLKIDNIPSSWHTNKMAGPDWFTKFMKRNPTLAIRTPEATSLSRTMSFNRTNVSEFFDKYKYLISTNI